MNTINAQTIINEAMAALAVAPDKTGSDFFDKIKIKTSERGHHLVQNNKSNIQKFIDLVRKNAAAFGGGLVRMAKPRPSVSWPANLVALFKQSIEDHDYRAALDIGDRLGALFYTSSKGNVFMQVAPVPCDFSERVVSVCNEDGKFSVIDPVSMRALAGLTLVQKRTRAAQVENVRLKLESMPSFDLDAAIDKQSAFAVDQSILRAQWILEHGMDSEAIETRIDAHNAQIEEQASQDVAQVVAQALTTIAITEAMADTSEDARELVTCEAGESEASAPTAGRASWAPAPQYVPPSLSQIKPGEPVPPAYRGGMDDIDPPSDGNAVDTPHPMESTDECEDWQNIANDIPLSLAVSAFGGVSMSPERRGASSKSEYGQSMAADYETLRAQAVKGGTLDLLPEVFARYRARQAGSYKAYLSSSSRCVSSFIAGPSNFPAARMNKRADIAHKRLTEYLDGGKMALQAAIRTLRPDLRAIMAGDADAIDRLTVKIEAAERAQAQMKAANKAIRANAKQGEAHQVAALMELGYREDVALSLLHPQFAYQGQGFPSYSLTNNNANIRRMRERLEHISKAQAQEVQAVECANGVTLEDDAPANRVRLFFPGKPSEAIRTELKSSGFRWAPSVGAWQAYRNHGTLATARRMAGEPMPAAPEVEQVEPIEATPTVAVSTEAPTPAPVEFLEALADAPAPAAPTLQSEWLAATQTNRIEGKSGKWLAWFWITSAGVIALGFSKQGQAVELNTYDTASERMAALQAMARAADAPTDTPPGGGLPCPVKTPIAHALAVALLPVLALTPTTAPAVSSATPGGAVAVRRNIVPDNGHYIVDPAFEAWTFTSGARFAFVMYLGKSAKPWKYYGYSTEAKRNEGFQRYAADAREILANKAKRKADSKAQADKPHGLQVGDVVRNSWGYDQTNVNHYQIIKVIGKRTVEVRELNENHESTGDMTGRASPVWGDFAGEPMRRQVDKHGQVNMLSASYGRASKIEPLAIVHGVRCYASSHYSSYA